MPVFIDSPEHPVTGGTCARALSLDIGLVRNIFEIDAYDIHKTRVMLAMRGGEIVEEASVE